jgi:hypothetical protein
MTITEQHLLFFKEFLSILTWKRVGILAVTVVIIIILSGVYAFRKELFSHTTENRLSVNTTLTVSMSTRDEIDSVVRRSPLISGIRVTSINFQRNIKTDSYINFKSTLVAELYGKFVNNRVYEIPLFDDSKDRNRRIFKLIGGEFVCSPIKDTNDVPGLEAHITSVCEAAIPPYHGDFSGILTLYLLNTPTKNDTESLFLLSRDLAVKIYEENKYAIHNK